MIYTKLRKANVSALGDDGTFGGDHIAIYLRGIASNRVDECVVGSPARFYRGVKGSVVVTHVGKGVIDFWSLGIGPL